MVVAAAVIVAAIAFVVVYAFNDPTVGGWFPQCAFFKLTGLKCPGCGSQRMFHALFTGDFKAMWGYNALLAVAWPLVLAMIVVEAYRERWPRLYARFNNLWVIIGSAVVLTAWWILRNIFGW